MQRVKLVCHIGGSHGDAAHADEDIVAFSPLFTLIMGNVNPD